MVWILWWTSVEICPTGSNQSSELRDDDDDEEEDDDDDDNNNDNSNNNNTRVLWFYTEFGVVCYWHTQ